MEFPNGISEWNFQFFSKVKFLNGCSKRAKRGSVALLSVRSFFFLSRKENLSTSEGGIFRHPEGESFVKSWRYPCKYVKMKKFEGKIL